ncbi:MAG: hypothetical protein OXD43_09625 [Bacteroidetes bacterium]|nr:hypothetical protein [Bacteroidota bacterium]
MTAITVTGILLGGIYYVKTSKDGGKVLLDSIASLNDSIASLNVSIVALNDKIKELEEDIGPGAPHCMKDKNENTQLLMTIDVRSRARYNIEYAQNPKVRQRWLDLHNYLGGLHGQEINLDTLKILRDKAYRAGNGDVRGSCRFYIRLTDGGAGKSTINNLWMDDLQGYFYGKIQTD